MMPKIRSIIVVLAIVTTGCVQPLPTDSSSLENRSPIIRSLRADPPSIAVGSICTLTVEADDPEGDAITYAWYASAGDIIGQGPSVRYTASFCCTGSNKVTVTVTDERGASSSKSIDVYVAR